MDTDPGPVLGGGGAEEDPLDELLLLLLEELLDLDDDLLELLDFCFGAGSPVSSASYGDFSVLDGGVTVATTSSTSPEPSFRN